MGGRICGVWLCRIRCCFFVFQAEDGIRDTSATGVQTCALPIYAPNTYNSVAFTTTHAGTGNYLISGLTPGTYSVLQNGASIPGNTSTAVGADGTLFFKATAGAFSVALQSPATVSPCDLNGDSFVNILDVQIAVNISRGIIPCPQ